MFVSWRLIVANDRVRLEAAQAGPRRQDRTGKLIWNQAQQASRRFAASRGQPTRAAPCSDLLRGERRRTLANLYNERPAWLANAHAALDAAVLGAYGWPGDLPDEQVLGRLLELNLGRRDA